MTMDGFLYSPDWDPHVDPRKKKTLILDLKLHSKYPTSVKQKTPNFSWLDLKNLKGKLWNKGQPKTK